MDFEVVAQLLALQERKWVFSLLRLFVLIQWLRLSFYMMAPLPQMM